MEAAIMTRKYNLSLVFYPQRDGQYHVECPELENCFSCGATKEEARTRIYELIAEDLHERVNWGAAEDEEMFREGLCMKGKIFEEAEFQIDESGEVVFSEALALA
jgi:predicted RNase H-like HicB family nuclease